MPLISPPRSRSLSKSSSETEPDSAPAPSASPPTMSFSGSSVPVTEDTEPISDIDSSLPLDGKLGDSSFMLASAYGSDATLQTTKDLASTLYGGALRQGTGPKRIPGSTDVDAAFIKSLCGPMSKGRLLKGLTDSGLALDAGVAPAIEAINKPLFGLPMGPTIDEFIPEIVNQCRNKGVNKAEF